MSWKRATGARRKYIFHVFGSLKDYSCDSIVRISPCPPEILLIFFTLGV